MSARRDLGQRFEYSIQKARVEAGLETMTEKEKRAFKAMIRSMLIYRPNERATAQQIALRMDERLGSTTVGTELEYFYMSRGILCE